MENAKSSKQELLEYIEAMTPEQAEKAIARLDLLKKCLAMDDNQAIYTSVFTGKLFFGE